MLHLIQIVLKGKCGSQWFDLKQFVDANKIRDFVTMNSKLQIHFDELQMKWSLCFNEFVHTNSVFVRKTLNSFIRIFSMLCCEWPVL